MFTGQVIPAARNIVLVYSGDPDSDNSGWIFHLGEASATLTTNTPHPQTVPDTITAKTVYGFERNLYVTMPAGLVDDEWVRFVKELPNVNSLTHLEIKDTAGSGSIYAIDMKLVASGAGTLVPIAVYPDNSHFKKISVTWTNQDRFVIDVQVKAGASGANYVVQMTTRDFDLAQVQAGGTKAPPDTYHSTIKADEKYPGDELANFLKAQSGDAAATVPAGKLPGDSLNGRTISLSVTKVYKYTGTFFNPNNNYTPLLRFNNAGGHPNFADTAQVQQIVGLKSLSDNKVAVWPQAEIDSGGGDQFCKVTPSGVKGNTYGTFELTIDTRNPNFALVKSKVMYTAPNGVHVVAEWAVRILPAHIPTGFYYSHYNHDGVCEWFVFEG